MPKKKSIESRKVKKVNSQKYTTKKVTLKNASRTNEECKLTISDEKILKLHDELKLQIELVPETCWYKNIRSTLTNEQWDKIRRQAYIKSQYICEICGGKGDTYPVECHEVWIYDDASLVQRLGYFQAICPMCHKVKHIGRAKMGDELKNIIKHFMKVNNLDKTTANKIIDVVGKRWKIRSSKKWKHDLEHLKEYGIVISK